MSDHEVPETEQAPVAFAITGGGEPTAEQLAAVTVALTPVAAPDDGRDTHAMRSGWARAALVEGIGGRTPVSLPDLQQGRFGLGHVGDPRAPLA